MKEGIYRVIVIPDVQVPFQDDRSMAAVEKYMADHTWDEYINLGDFMDFNCISSFNKGQLRKIEGQTIHDDYEVGNEILDRHQKIIRKRNPKAKFTLLEGNHDFRIERYIDENPQTKGSIEVEVGLHLKERGFKYVRCYQKGETYNIGNAYFTHGLYANETHAKKHVDRFGVNIFYGHTHDVQSSSKVIMGKDKTIVGQSLGCLCRYDQSYIKGNPTNWQHAFGIFYFMPDGFFTYYVPRIFKHRFISPEGKLYQG